MRKTEKWRWTDAFRGLGQYFWLIALPFAFVLLVSGLDLGLCAYSAVTGQPLACVYPDDESVVLVAPWQYHDGTVPRFRDDWWYLACASLFGFAVSAVVAAGLFIVVVQAHRIVNRRKTGRTRRRIKR